jgi:ABC-type transport system substrate-binding protein
LAQPTVTTLIIPGEARPGKGADYNRNPVGTGPFVFKEWRAADRLVAERNPDYWDKDKPYLDRVTVRPLPDSDARYASLVKGDVQVIWEDRAENIVKAKKDKNLRVLQWVGSGALVIRSHPARTAERQAGAAGRLDGAEPQGQRRRPDPGAAPRP